MKHSCARSSRQGNARSMRTLTFLSIAAALATAGCAQTAALSVAEGTGAHPILPPPRHSLLPTVNIAPARGWPIGAAPHAAAGLHATAFAAGLDHPRWLLVLPNGDVLVAETNSPPKPKGRGSIRQWAMGIMMKRAGAGVPSANRITLLRDSDGDGVAEFRSVFLAGLESPFGMALIADRFFVANADAVMGFPYKTGDTAITAPGTKLLDLPGGPINHHWTKNLLPSADGRRLYVSVGSNSNVAENGMAVEDGRAAIWEVDAVSGAHRIYANGLRNPVGMAWSDAGQTLWTVVNERDEIGGDLVPDYLTSVHEGDFFGWPWSYYGQHVDHRARPAQPARVAGAVVPDYALGPHTGSLGLASSAGSRLPAPFIDGMFVGQHGSWNRKPRSGYKVIFVPFSNGKPVGMPVEVASGFLDDSGNAQGRPVGVAIDRQGDLLVADDVGNMVWRISAQP